jgi:BASS family bile acid:Na+ symporter
MVSIAALIDISVPILTFSLMVAVGMDLSSDDFRRVRRTPAVILTGLIGPLVLLPPIAVGLAWAFSPPPAVAGSLLLIAACPIGGISNTYSYLARASTALSVALTGLSCLLAGVTMPALGRVFGVLFPDVVVDAPPAATFLVQLLPMLALPIALGMWVRRRHAAWALRVQPTVQRLTFMGVGLVLLLVVLDDPRAFLSDLSAMVALAVAFVLCSSAAGWLAGASVTADPRDRFTIAVEFGTRNLGVAMAVAVTLLGRVEFARFAYAYFLTEMPIMLLAAAWFRRRSPAPARAAPPVTAAR